MPARPELRAVPGPDRAASLRLSVYDVWDGNTVTDGSLLLCVKAFRHGERDRNTRILQAALHQQCQ